MPCVPLIMLAIATTPPTQSSSASAPKRRIRVRSAWGRRDRQGIEAKRKHHFAPPAHRTADRRRVAGRASSVTARSEFCGGSLPIAVPMNRTRTRRHWPPSAGTAWRVFHRPCSDTTSRHLTTRLGQLCSPSSVRRAGVLAGLVLVFRRSAEPRTGSQSVHKSCTGRAGTGRHSPVRAGRSITKRQLRAHELDVDGRTGPLRRNLNPPLRKEVRVRIPPRAPSAECQLRVIRTWLRGSLIDTQRSLVHGGDTIVGCQRSAR